MSCVVDDFSGSYSILKGKVIFEPVYIEQELKEYANNPFIEALPGLFGEEDIIYQFKMYPNIDQDERFMQSKVRYHMIKRLKNFVQPLSIHFDIERKISTLIRRGYLARNPFSKEYLQRLQLINRVKKEATQNKYEKLEEISETLRSTASSFSIIGLSGMGKSTAIERLLMMYPQVITHSEYKDKPMTKTQIVWLKIDCPYDGSLKTLCKIFFRAVDDILGTTRYLKKYGVQKNSPATMMIHMTYVASVHAIGVLVIDEIQYLMNPKNNPDEMLNFFVTLANTIGVPIILVGTFKALKLFQKDFAQGRRVSSEGSIVWDRMEKDDEWDFFLETMWDFQWLNNFTPLDEELNSTMYDACQGITSVAVTLFMLVQERALNNAERLTPKLIKDTAERDLKIIQGIIKALRNNDPQEIMRYDDIVINLEEILGNTRQKLALRGMVSALAKQQTRIVEEKKGDLRERLFTDLNNMGMFSELNSTQLMEVAENVIRSIGIDGEYKKIMQKAVKLAIEKNEEVESKKELVVKKVSTGSGEIMKLYNKAMKEKRHVYELLKENGLIKNPVEEFYMLDT